MEKLARLHFRAVRVAVAVISRPARLRRARSLGNATERLRDAFRARLGLPGGRILVFDGDRSELFHFGSLTFSLKSPASSLASIPLPKKACHSFLNLHFCEQRLSA